MAADSAKSGAGTKGTTRATARFARVQLGLRLAGFIYGTIVALSVIVAGARAFPHNPSKIAVLVSVTCLVFWVAHVYAHSLGDSVAHGQRISWAELKHIAHREASIIEAAVPPVAALLLGAVGLVGEPIAVWAAFVLGLVVLGAEGLAVARIERLGLLPTVGVVAANLALGLVVVALKIFVGH